MSYEILTQVKKQKDLSGRELSEIVALCTQAFQRDYAPYLKSFEGSTHIFSRYRGRLVCHALWVTRWLQYADLPVFRTAYVEGMATEISFRYQGFASSVMRRLAEEIKDFDLCALSTSSMGFYSRLGWQQWQGPLFVRTPDGIKLVPNEVAMILVLPNTPPLDLASPLSVEWREGEIW
jgi:aminoglycoside 2'-N-acetyltransferase I